MAITATKIKIGFLLVLVVATPVIMSAQSKPAHLPMDAEKFLGGLTNGVYRNDFFKFSVNVAPEFYVLTEGEVSAYKKSGVKLLSEGIKGNRDSFEKAAAAEVILFSISEYGPGTPGNSSLIIGALRQPDGVSSSMVANATKDFLLKNPSFLMVKDTAPIKIANKDFSILELSSYVNGLTLNFSYCVTIHKGHSLTFVIMYLKNESREKFEKVLNTLAFDPK